MDLYLLPQEETHSTIMEENEESVQTPKRSVKSVKPMTPKKPVTPVRKYSPAPTPPPVPKTLPQPPPVPQSRERIVYIKEKPEVVYIKEKPDPTIRETLNKNREYKEQLKQHEVLLRQQKEQIDRIEQL